MQPVPVRRPLTYREFALLPEDGRRWELIAGDFFVSPAPTPWHQTVSRRLQYALMTALEEPGTAQVFNAPVDLILSDTDVVEPDLVIVRRELWASITSRGIEAPPDVVVEILSPSTRDRDRYLKRSLYERFGVGEYWVVEPVSGYVEQWVLSEGAYALRARFDRTSTLTSPAFPELRIPLERVFRDAPASAR